MSSHIDAEKLLARKQAKSRRIAAAKNNPDAASAAMENLLSYIGQQKIQAVAAYLPIGSELDTLPLMAHCAKSGIETALPVVVAEATPLIFRSYQIGDSLITEAFSTKAPTADAAEVVPNLVLVPMLAFDHLGYRLGYGGGFYDRTIALFQKRHPETSFVGYAFADQQTESVPIGAYDIALSAIITERGVVQGKAG